MSGLRWSVAISVLVFIVHLHATQRFTFRDNSGSDTEEETRVILCSQPPL